MALSQFNFAEPLEILYQDDQLIAINKPVGLLVHRSRIDPSAKEFAVQRLRDQVGAQVFLVHRLDRPTSGVLLFATSSKNAACMSRQFERRQVTKGYTAIVRGYAGVGEWDEPLVEKQDRIVDRLAQKNKTAQSAFTRYFQLNSWEIGYSAGKYPTSRYSLVRIEPRSGRKHQIRRHFNHMAHPIVGDTTYGDRRHNRLFREQLGCDRLLLAATELQFDHPVTGARIKVGAPLGKKFDRIIESLDRQAAVLKAGGQNV